MQVYARDTRCRILVVFSQPNAVSGARFESTGYGFLRLLDSLLPKPVDNLLAKRARA